jgi:methionine-rich copper-binding protein CopC
MIYSVLKMKTTNRHTVIVLLLLLAVSAGLLASTAISASPQPGMGYQFSTPVKAAHWKSNTPSSGMVLSAVPSQVKIDTDFNMGPGDYISISKDGKEYGMGDTVLSSDKLSVTRRMDPNAPNGLYTVNYELCWPDGTCHIGQYQFAIQK